MDPRSVNLTPNVRVVDGNRDGHFEPCGQGTVPSQNDHFEIRDGRAWKKVCLDSSSVKRLLKSRGLKDLSGRVSQLPIFFSAVARLGMKQKRMRLIAAMQIANSESISAIEPLRAQLVKEKSIDVVAEIAWALSRLGDKTYISILLKKNFKSKAITKAARVKGVQFKAGSRVWFDAKGAIAFAHIKKDQVIGSLPCKANTLLIFKGGKLSRAILSRDSALKPRGPVFAKGTAFFVGPRGRMVCGTLAQDKVIGKVPCKKGSKLVIGPHGKPMSATLSKAHRFGKITLTAGSRFTLLPKGGLFSVLLSSDQMIDGVPCKGGNRVMFHKGKLTRFTLSRAHKFKGVAISAGTTVVLNRKQEVLGYTNQSDYTVGRVSLRGGTFFGRRFKQMGGTLSKDQVIGGVPCRGMEEVVLHKNGRVAKAVISKNWLTQGKSIRELSTVSFDDKGRIRHIAHPNGVTVNGVAFSRVSRFYSNGNVSLGRLAKNRVFGKVMCRKGWAQFYRNGRLARCTLNKAATPKRNVFCTPGHYVTYLDNGRFGSCRISRPLTTAGVKCAKNKHASFSRKGRLSSCVLDGNRTVEKIPLKGGSWVYFHPNGKLARGIVTKAKIIEGIAYAVGARFRTKPYWEYSRTWTRTLMSSRKSGKAKRSPLSSYISLMRDAISQTVEDELKAERNKGVVGKVTRIILDKRYTYIKTQRRGVSFSFYWEVDDLLQNVPPFGDCDGKVRLNAALRWKVKNNQIVFSFDSIYSRHIGAFFPWCPAHTPLAAGYLKMQMWKNVFSVGGHPLVKGENLVQAQSGVTINYHIKKFITRIAKLPNAVKASIRVKDLWIDKGGLKVRFGYKVRIYHKPKR